MTTPFHNHSPHSKHLARLPQGGGEAGEATADLGPGGEGAESKLRLPLQQLLVAPAISLPPAVAVSVPEVHADAGPQSSLLHSSLALGPSSADLRREQEVEDAKLAEAAAEADGTRNESKHLLLANMTFKLGDWSTACRHYNEQLKIEMQELVRARYLAALVVVRSCVTFATGNAVVQWA